MKKNAKNARRSGRRRVAFVGGIDRVIPRRQEEGSAQRSRDAGQREARGGRPRGHLPRHQMSMRPARPDQRDEPLHAQRVLLLSPALPACPSPPAALAVFSCSSCLLSQNRFVSTTNYSWQLRSDKRFKFYTSTYLDKQHIRQLVDQQKRKSTLIPRVEPRNYLVLV